MSAGIVELDTRRLSSESGRRSSASTVGSVRTKTSIQEELPQLERIAHRPTFNRPPTGPRPSGLLYVAVAVSTLPWFVFGFDTGSIGAITTQPQFEDVFGTLAPLLRGFVVSCILLPSAATGAFAGPIADRISRKYTIAIGAALFAIGSAITVGVSSLAALIVARCIAGAGEGLFLSIVTTYTSEISPKSLRGRMVSASQLGTTGGVTAGFFSVYGCTNATSLASSPWAYRIPFLLQTVISAALAAVMLAMPFSPRWLVLRGRTDEAEQVLESLNKPGAEFEKDMLEIPPAGPNVSLADLFGKGVAFRTLFGCFIQAAQQLSGIDAVLYYAPTLFEQAGLSGKTSSLIASGVTGIVLLVATLVAQPFTDRIGRRFMMVAGGLVLGFSLVVIGLLYATNAADRSAVRWTIIALIEVYVIGFSTTWAMTSRLYAAEIQPAKTRATATGVGQCAWLYRTNLTTGVNQAVNFVVALTTPLFLSKSNFGPYILYGGFSLLTSAVCLAFMIETRGKSLEAIDREFADFTPTAALREYVAAVKHRFRKTPSSPPPIALAPRRSNAL